VFGVEHAKRFGLAKGVGEALKGVGGNVELRERWHLADGLGKGLEVVVSEHEVSNAGEMADRGVKLSDSVAREVHVL
jgi:hypothetical protein